MPATYRREQNASPTLLFSRERFSPAPLRPIPAIAIGLLGNPARDLHGYLCRESSKLRPQQKFFSSSNGMRARSLKRHVRPPCGCCRLPPRPLVPRVFVRIRIIIGILAERSQSPGSRSGHRCVLRIPAALERAMVVQLKVGLLRGRFAEDHFHQSFFLPGSFRHQPDADRHCFWPGGKGLAGYGHHKSALLPRVGRRPSAPRS